MSGEEFPVELLRSPVESLKESLPVELLGEPPDTSHTICAGTRQTDQNGLNQHGSIPATKPPHRRERQSNVANARENSGGFPFLIQLQQRCSTTLNTLESCTSRALGRA